MANNMTDMGQCFFLTEVMQIPKGATYVTAIVTCVLNTIFSLTSAVSNSIILLVIIKTPSLHTPANVLLGCLASSDFVIGVVTQPAYVTYKIAEILIARRVSCVARVTHWVVGWVCAGVSMMTITGLAVERFLALHLHLRYVVIVTVRRAIVVVVIFWGFGVVIILSLFALKSDRYWTFVPAPVMILNLIITATAYWKIYRILQKHRTQINRQMQAQVSRQDGQHISAVNIKRYRKSAVTAMYVLALLLLCYIPFFCSMVTRVVVGYKPAVKIAYELAATLVYLNSTLNPILFCYRVPDIRREAKKLLKNSVCLRTRRTHVVGVESLPHRQSKTDGVFLRPEIKMLYW